VVLTANRLYINHIRKLSRRIKVLVCYPTLKSWLHGHCCHIQSCASTCARAQAQRTGHANWNFRATGPSAKSQKPLLCAVRGKTRGHGAGLRRTVPAGPPYSTLLIPRTVTACHRAEARAPLNPPLDRSAQHAHAVAVLHCIALYMMRPTGHGRPAPSIINPRNATHCLPRQLPLLLWFLLLPSLAEHLQGGVSNPVGARVREASLRGE
jgi:hypothetical protein